MFQQLLSYVHDIVFSVILHYRISNYIRDQLYILIYNVHGMFNNTFRNTKLIKQNRRLIKSFSRMLSDINFKCYTTTRRKKILQKIQIFPKTERKRAALNRHNETN